MEKFPKTLKYIIVMFVAWKISDEILELIYNSIDNAILSSPSSANGLLIALKSIVGFIGFDLVSFLIAVIVCLLALIKSNSD
jgi:hypothetical protein